MMHLAAFSSAMVDETTSQQVTALSDVIISVRDNAIIVPTKPRNLNMVLAAFAQCLDITRANLQPPSMRNVGFFDMRPIQTAVPTLDSQWIVHDFQDNPLVLVPGEELPLYITMTDAGTPTAYGGVLLGRCTAAALQRQVFYRPLVGHDHSHGSRLEFMHPDL